MKISKREITLLTTLFILICGFLYYNFYFTPAMTEIEEIDAEIETLDAVMKEAQMKVAAVASLKKRAESLRAEAGEKLENVMTSIDQPEMLMMVSSELDGLSHESSVVFKPDYQEMDNCRLYSVKAEFMTDYISFRQILDRLKEAPYLNRLVVGTLKKRKLSQVKGAREPEEYSLEAEINIEFFTLDGSPTGTEYPFMTNNYPNELLFT